MRKSTPPPSRKASSRRALSRPVLSGQLMPPEEPARLPSGVADLLSPGPEAALQERPEVILFPGPEAVTAPAEQARPDTAPEPAPAQAPAPAPARAQAPANGGRKRLPRNRGIKKLPDSAFSNSQLTLFQEFLSNTPDEDGSLSNAVDLWDNIPRYAVSRRKQEELRLPGGFLPIYHANFHYRGKTYALQIRPARLAVRDDAGQLTGETVEYYPSAREELIEHALRKLASESSMGFFDPRDYRSGVAFSLHRLRQELARQGHAMTYRGLSEGLEILHYASLSIIDGDTSASDPGMMSQSYLPALARVNRNGRANDPDARWFVQFHSLVTDSINKITYRQFNYQRLMMCSSQIARWLISQLVLKYTQAALSNSFEMRFSTIRRDSGLLNGYRLDRQAIAAVDGAWEELKTLGILSSVDKSEVRGTRMKLEEVVYSLYPSREFVAEQKAANYRLLASREPSPAELPPPRG